MSEPTNLERLLAESTPGPWYEKNSTICTDVVRAIVDGKRVDITTPAMEYEDENPGYFDVPIQYPNAEADAALIVAMRNALPAILSDYRVMREALERVQDVGDLAAVRVAQDALASLSSPQEDQE